MKNTENWWKSKIMSSFLFAVFPYMVLHGEGRLIMKEGLELGWFFIIRSFQAVPKVTKNAKNWFSEMNYVIMTSHDDFS